jgi:hypothetical protein
LLDLHEKITPETMQAYDKVFAMPIPIDILRAIAALIDRELPQAPDALPCTVLPGQVLQI